MVNLGFRSRPFMVMKAPLFPIVSLHRNTQKENTSVEVNCSYGRKMDIIIWVLLPHAMILLKCTDPNTWPLFNFQFFLYMKGKSHKKLQHIIAWWGGCTHDMMATDITKWWSCTNSFDEITLCKWYATANNNVTTMPTTISQVNKACAQTIIIYRIGLYSNSKQCQMHKLHKSKQLHMLLFKQKTKKGWTWTASDISYFSC